MRRLILPLAMLALTGTLVAQAPRAIPLTMPNKFNANVTFSSMQQDGDKMRMKDVRVEFALGITIVADELLFDKAKAGESQLSGNVKMILKQSGSPGR